MQEQFYGLADDLTKRLRVDEVLLLNFHGEESDFVRFNNSLVRQAGAVNQRSLSLELIRGDRHVKVGVGLGGSAQEDRQAAEAALERTRAMLASVPADPYLLYAVDIHSGQQHGQNRLPEPAQVVEKVLHHGSGRDLVGIYAQGGIFGGFANSLGQRNWFSSYSFHLDWSFYHRADKAVKSTYAGFAWDDAALTGKMDWAKSQLEVLAREPRTVPPGQYRVYLAPPALADFVGMLGWCGFGLKAHRTKNTSLLKMQEGATLAPAVSLCENAQDGIAPDFQSSGFIKPQRVNLITAGKLGDLLISPRSAREYGLPANGANDGESPESMEMAAGQIDAADVASRLGEGVYVNSVWYLNYSDRPSCRITGMTRFATFWVEGGRIVAPLNVMRFDETGFRVLGENLLGLTRERDFIPSSSTYHGRSTSSIRLPGALVENFAFTL